MQELAVTLQGLCLLTCEMGSHKLQKANVFAYFFKFIEKTFGGVCICFAGVFGCFPHNLGKHFIGRLFQVRQSVRINAFGRYHRGSLTPYC